MNGVPEQDRIVGMKDGDIRRLKGTDDVAVSFVVTVLLSDAAATDIRHPGVTLTEAYNRAEAVIRGQPFPTK